MGDRVAVIKLGRLQQVDTPQVLYDEPVNLFVGGFIGSPAMNMVEATLERDDDGVWVAFGDIRLGMPDEVAAKRPGLARFEGGKVVLGHPAREHRGRRRSRATRRTIAGSARPSSFARRSGSEVLVHFNVARRAGADGGHEGARAGSGHARPAERRRRRRRRPSSRGWARARARRSARRSSSRSTPRASTSSTRTPG